MEELRFNGRVVVVTGAGRGIGRSHALAFAARGARVVVADLGAEIDGSGSSTGPAEEVTAEIRAAGGEAVTSFADVADPDSAASIVDAALDAWGRVDVVVNNAGISDSTPFGELTVEQLRRMVDVHYLGAAFVTRAAWPHLVAAGYGRIVNTTSEAALGGITELTAYGAAKGAVWGLTRNLATEGAAHGILANAIAPRAHSRMAVADAGRIADLLGLDEERQAVSRAAMLPEHNTPAALYLAHKSCVLNGEVLQTGAGTVARLAIVHGPGITTLPLTPELIAERLDAVLDIRGAGVTSAEPYHLRSRG